MPYALYTNKAAAEQDLRILQAYHDSTYTIGPRVLCFVITTRDGSYALNIPDEPLELHSDTIVASLDPLPESSSTPVELSEV